MRLNRRRFTATMLSAPAVLAPHPPVSANPARLRAANMLPARQQAAFLHGIDPADMDLSADPRDDFYRYANGGWLDRVTIPGDKSRYGVMTEMKDRTTGQLLGLLANLARSTALESGTDEWKAVQIFAQGMDVKTRNAQGMAPIEGTLRDIQTIDGPAAFHEHLAAGIWQGMPGLFNLAVLPDLEDSSINVLYLNGPSLRLPNRDYYLNEGEYFDGARAACVQTFANMLTFTGQEPGAAASAAQTMFAFERELATEVLSEEETYDFDRIYNPVSLAELSALYPLMDWQHWFNSLGLRKVDKVVVTELRYMEALSRIIGQTSLDVLKGWLTAGTVWSFAANLSEELEAAEFAFEKVLSGVAEQPPRARRVLDEVSDSLPDAIGRLYVAGYFPPEAKQRITELVAALLAAFRARLDKNDWITPGTRVKAQEKLDKLGVKVGYPDTWQTYEDVEVGDSYAQSLLSATQAQMRRDFKRCGQAVDRSRWDIPAQLVNAFYDPQVNQIVFPAAILQAPFFDHEADPASNFGSIGFVIGHEITHGFDKGGAQFDGDGNRANWWSEQDFAAFDALNRRVVAQYSAIEAAPGHFINGQLTVGENVADFGGTQTALDALAQHLSDHGHSLGDVVESPLTALAATPEASPVAAYATPVASPAVATPQAMHVAQALTQRERFFVAAAMTWREKIRPEALITQLQTDTHSPAKVRATQPLRNMDAYHDAFEIESGDALYLPPEERVVIW